ncbi:MAG: hypothetical protein A2669_00100 [Candidatus Yanofskybacteria bacterium RIFCSPHIGHO2_01_FULL_48_25b]|uniref:Uncharacterized protein n=1 Tax=Candidatus Yanofskybacteria bacterium RIFCSPHIGHO2_01_FULL_48_25b TaxID=1802672 RepID=A0A1F8F0T1_9BACT|nr:MAG: hypothetical protein A2669_00100 [Candidatus Yanofskybacteria bacterium RIFCSPHIGHO2_01_FULL_48_25b]
MRLEIWQAPDEPNQFGHGAISNKVAMPQKIIIVRSQNQTPENEVNDRLHRLNPGWCVISAQTSLAPYGMMEYKGIDVAQHVYFVTTLVLEKKPRKK